MGGFDPLTLLTERDPVRLAVAEAVIERQQEIATQYRRDVAIRTANAIGGKD